MHLHNKQLYKNPEVFGQIWEQVTNNLSLKLSVSDPREPNFPARTIMSDMLCVKIRKNQD